VIRCELPSSEVSKRAGQKLSESQVNRGEQESGKADLKLRKPQVNATIHIVTPVLRIAQGARRLCNVKMRIQFFHLVAQVPFFPENEGALWVSD
jgi:hypothetical protein